MKKVIVLLSLLISSLAFAQANQQPQCRIRDATDPTVVAAVAAGGASIAATVVGLTTRSMSYGYDAITDNRWERTLQDPDGYPRSNVSPTYPGYTRQQDGDSTVVRDISDSFADDQSTTLNGAWSACVQYLYDGATTDMARSTASGAAAVEDTSVRAGEDVANGWRRIKKEAIATNAPAKTSTASAGTTAVVVLASLDVSGYPNCVVYLRNTDAADPFTDAAIYTSPDNAGTCGDVNWVSLTWTTCDGLVATNTCSYEFSNKSYKYLCVKVAATDANPVSVDAWIVCNVN